MIQQVAVEVEFVIEEFAVQRAEGAESVGGEECFIGAVVGNHNFGPVNHGRHDKMEFMFAGGEGIAFGNDFYAAVHIEGEELLHHFQCFFVADEGGFGISFADDFKNGGVVRFHMVDDDIVKRSAVQHMGEVFHEQAADGMVYRIEKDGFFVIKKIGVVRNAFGNGKYIFKKLQTAVVAADPGQIIGDFFYTVHIFFLSSDNL